MTDDPFRDAINHLNLQQRVTFNQMESRCHGVRSSGWLNQASFGSRRVNPPPPDTLDGFAALFGKTTEQIAAMAAESWYGVRIEDASDRVKRMAPAIDALDAADAEIVERLLARLATKDSETASEGLSDEDQAANKTAQVPDVAFAASTGTASVGD